MFSLKQRVSASQRLSHGRARNSMFRALARGSVTRVSRRAVPCPRTVLKFDSALRVTLQQARPSSSTPASDSDCYRGLKHCWCKSRREEIAVRSKKTERPGRRRSVSKIQPAGHVPGKTNGGLVCPRPSPTLRIPAFLRQAQRQAARRGAGHVSRQVPDSAAGHVVA